MSNIPQAAYAVHGSPVRGEEDLAAAFVGLSIQHVIDPAVERRARRKLDAFFMPTMIFIYMLMFYDKAILSSATLLGISTDLQLAVVVDATTTPPTVSTLRLSWATSLFYFGLLAGTYPWALVLQRFPLGRVLGPSIVIWGIVTMLTAAVTSWRGLFAQRFFLGLMESVIPNSFAMIVSNFYTQREQASRQSFWYSANAWGIVLGNLISYGFANIRGGALARWRYLYLFAGGLTVLVGFFSFCIPDSPMQAWFLTRDERVAATERLRHGQAGVRNHKIKLRHVRDALRDAKVWLIMAMIFLTYMINGALIGFGPLIVNTFGWDALQSILLQLPLGVIAGVVTVVTGVVATKVRNTMLLQLALCALPTMAGVLMIWKSDWYYHAALPVVGYALLGFLSGCASLTVAAGMSNVAGATKKSVMSATIFVGYSVANIASPFLVVSQTKEAHYPLLWTALTACCCLLIATTSVLGIHLLRLNRIRARQLAAGGSEKTAAETGFLDLSDSVNVHFRYAL